MPKNLYNKDLKDLLGPKKEDYCLSIPISKKNDRHKEWKKQRKEYGFDEREIWNLDNTIEKFLYTRLKMLQREAVTVNWDRDRRQWRGLDLTYGELIEAAISYLEVTLLFEKNNHDFLWDLRTIEETDRVCRWDDELHTLETAAIDTFRLALELISIVFPALWW